MPSIVVTNTKTERKIMGLAASQARFLAITSRKMNCEFQSMQLAQQKLSVTRDLQKASQDYQSAITASQLVWETEDGSVYNVTYDTMMRPSVLNEYDPYLLTDKRGRIVLNKAMFNAAKDAGIIDEKGNPIGTYTCGLSSATNDGSRNAFLYQLGVRNQIAPAVANMVVDLGEAWYTKSGIGGEIFDKTISTIMTTNTFIDYLTNATALDEDRNEYLVFTLLGKEDDGKYKNLGTSSFTDKFLTSSVDVTEGKYIIMSKGKILSQEDIEELTLGKILSGDYTVSYVNADSEKDNTNADMNFIVELLHKTFRGVDSDAGLLYTDPVAKAALDAAAMFTKNLYKDSNATKVSNSQDVIYKLKDGDTSAGDKNNAILYNGGSKNITTASLTNMLNAYLTYFAISLEGYDKGLCVDNKSMSSSTFVTDDLNYNFVLNSPESISEQDVLNAEFYNMLYNNICMYGACTDEVMQEQVMDKEYLSYAIKNGQIFVSSLHDDGYFYQGHYTQNGHIGEVPDQDAIAQAELDYEMTKSKLNYKEETIELKMKNLDMEISALTTEFDTVKNLISKNIEKVFTMFST